MIEKMSRMFGDFVVASGMPEEKKEIYIYGMECFLNEFLSDLLLIIAGLLLGRPLEILFWIPAFTLIRIFMGGYHASSHLKCLISGSILGIVCILLIPVIESLTLLKIFLLISGLFLVLLLAPVEGKKGVLDPEEKKMLRRRTLFFYLFGSLLILLFFFLRFAFDTALLLGMYSAVFLGLLGWIENYFRKKKQAQNEFSTTE